MDSLLNNILFMIVIFFSNIIQAITGFAGTMIAMPPAMILIGVRPAQVVLCVMGLLSCLMISLRNHQDIHRAEFLKISVWMGIGMVIGVVLLGMVQLNLLLQLYAGFIIVIALGKLLIHQTIGLPKAVSFLVLLSAGVVHGMFVSGGSLLVIYAASVFKNKSEFRATLSLVWVLLNLLLLSHYITEGYVTKDVLLLTMLCILPLGLAIYVGNLLHQRISQTVFMRLASVLLLLSGVLLLVQS